MTLPEPVAESTGAPPPQPVSQPTPAQQPVAQDIQQKAVREAQYYQRNPEVFQAVITELEKAGALDIHERIDTLEREIHVRDALEEYGLSKDAMQFIQGATKAEIQKAAAALRARDDVLKGQGGQPPLGAPPAKPQAGPPIPRLPETVTRQGLPSIAQAEADLMESGAEWCAAFSTDTLGHI